jgi:SAM-dependent methyltransferase
MKKKLPAGAVQADVAGMLRLTDPATSAPNINELWRLTKDMEAMKLTVKFFGYELAKALLSSLPPLPAGGPFQMPLASKPSTQADLEANWSRYWSAQIRERHAIHRRAWEHAFVLQALAQMGKMQQGMSGLGFASGGPLPAYLASKGCDLTVVDAQTPAADALFRSELLDRPAFDRKVKLRAADMSAIPQDLRGFDFCWSVGKLQHAGSVDRAMKFMEDMVDTLKPGGVAVHTTEFNFTIDDQNIDNWQIVLFQRRHFEEMAQRLARKGCRVLPLDFNVGSRPLDRFIDVPPLEMESPNIKDWSRDSMHIKVSIDGFPCTSFGMIVIKNS